MSHLPALSAASCQLNIGLCGCHETRGNATVELSEGDLSWQGTNESIACASWSKNFSKSR